MRIKLTWDGVFDRLKELGCREDRSNGNHGVWKTPGGRSFPVWQGDTTRRPSRDYIARISAALSAEGLSFGCEDEDEEEPLTTTTTEPEEEPKTDVFCPKPTVTIKRHRVIIDEEDGEAELSLWHVTEALRRFGVAIPDKAQGHKLRLSPNGGGVVLSWNVRDEKIEEI